MPSVGLSVFLALLLAGAVGVGGWLIARAIVTKRRLEYTLDFLEHFRLFVAALKGGVRDQRALDWLKERAERMQHLLGKHGRIEYWSPEGNYLERDYQVVLRTLGEMERGSISDHLTSSCQMTLLQFLGVLERRFR